MKYITHKNSETGKKIMACFEKITEAANQAKKLAISLGAKQWRGRNGVAAGGISSLVFDDVPDKKVWRNAYGRSNEWLPKLNTKEGKRIMSLIENLPYVSRDTLNQCIGFDGAPFKSIGVKIGKGEYVGFSVEEEWNVQVPDDCEEVTTSRYNEVIGKEASDD